MVQETENSTDLRSNCDMAAGASGGPVTRIKNGEPETNVSGQLKIIAVNTSVTKKTEFAYHTGLQEKELKYIPFLMLDKKQGTIENNLGKEWKRTTGLNGRLLNDTALNHNPRLLILPSLNLGFN